MKGRIPAFSALLLMVALSFVGIACLPMLNIKYKPSDSGRTIRVTWSYPGASPEIVEAEVTSRIEGVMSGAFRKHRNFVCIKKRIRNSFRDFS